MQGDSDDERPGQENMLHSNQVEMFDIAIDDL